MYSRKPLPYWESTSKEYGEGKRREKKLVPLFTWDFDISALISRRNDNYRHLYVFERLMTKTKMKKVAIWRVYKNLNKITDTSFSGGQFSVCAVMYCGQDEAYMSTERSP